MQVRTKRPEIPEMLKDLAKKRLPIGPLGQFHSKLLAFYPSARLLIPVAFENM